MALLRGGKAHQKACYLRDFLSGLFWKVLTWRRLIVMFSSDSSGFKLKSRVSVIFLDQFLHFKQLEEIIFWQKIREGYLAKEGD
jgi:hypothetical protein